MEILRNLRRLESKLANTADEAAQKIAQSRPREPLQILFAIVDAAEKRIEPVGRGRYVFPFDQINICVAAESTEARARFEAVFGSEPSLHNRILEQLHAAGCVLTGLGVNVTYVDRSEADWTNSEFKVEFERFAALPQRLKLTIVHGSTERASYVFTTSRVNLGRCGAVRDNRNRLIRTNHVA